MRTRRLSNMSFVLAFSAFCTASLAAESSLGFSFPSLNKPITDNIKLFYNSSLQHSGKVTLIQLTTNTAYSFGWAVYEKSIPVWHRSSGGRATFSTHFEFIIEPDVDNAFGAGGGLAFFMAPLGFKAPELPAGKWLGLFNTTTIGNPSNHIVAVEFDTDKNSHDPDDNHVGIDVNTVISEANYSLIDADLKDGKTWNAWVDYDGRLKKLQVFLSNGSSKPADSILRHDIDLAKFLVENVMVGFSASTSQGTAIFSLVSWDFSYKTSWNAESFSIEGTGNGSAVKEAKKKGSKTRTISVASACVAALCLILVGSGWWRYRKGRGRSTTEQESEMALDEEFSQGPRKFTYWELSAATRNFSEDQKLGHGGFGSVYRGVLPETREVVAVKRVSQTSKQGKKEYVAEVSIITRLGHRNLVQLLGWCHERGELLLVYEYMPNGSLDKRIFGDGDSLDWNRRYNIACGIASALVYLHEDCEQCILHRDVKSSNVMLDSNFNAKLGDFGLARLVERDTEASHTTVVAGTLGYLAPECVITGKATPESDVYSFGAVALEIACGRRALDERLREGYNMRLVQWVWDLYGQGRILDAAAESLRSEEVEVEVEVERLMTVGLWCSHPDPKARPSMRQVLKLLKLETPLPLPSIPHTMPVPVFLYTDPITTHVLPTTTTTLYGTCSHSTTPTTSLSPR